VGREPQRDELTFHFHLDRELLDLTSTFQFHVHFAGAQSRQRSPTELGRSFSLLAIKMPIVDEPNRARVTASGAFICAYGHAAFSGSPPTEVHGKVYDPNDIFVCDPLDPSTGIPLTPPGDAVPGQLINFNAYPTFPECTDPALCNYAFHCLYDNELPVALHSTEGASNCLVIWSRRGSTGPYKRDSVSFLAVTSTRTECDPCEGGTEGPSDVGQEFVPDLLVPNLTVTLDVATRNLVLPQLGQQFGSLLPRGAFQLAYDHHHAHAAAPEWKTAGCTKKHGDWRLRQTRLGPSSIGTLTLHALGGVKLSTPLEWQARGWQPGRPARFGAYRPAELVQAQSALKVEPR
jgi:hypothetical protein